ncbi:hypothetical protein V8C40DRAFT_281290 [Trichoderma camerunense]
MPAQKISSTRRKKRATSHDTDSEPRKRRARYALRACCECKRRKVRCDGHLPCEHCQSRSIQCIYDTDPNLLTNCACDALNQQNDCTEHKSNSTEVDTIVFSEIGRLARLVEHMQSQINVLIELNKGPSNGRGGNPFDTKSSPSSSCSVRSCSESAYEQDSAKHPSPRYWGATSSDYTLNVVRFCIRPVEPQLGYSCRHRKIACYTPDPTPDTYEGVEEPSESRPRMRACFCSDCTRCLRNLGKARALQLIDVYHEVIGHLHPVVDIEQQKSQVDAIYALLESAPGTRSTDPEIEQDRLDITKMVLSIALLAQTTGQSDIASALYNSIQIRIQDAMTSDTKNIQNVVLTLLAAIYHFFHDDVQLAWRMGGISGRMAMELGLHHREARRAENESSDHGMITNILWSIVILDRLWSCSIGLPQNFQDADFAKSLPEPVEAPYLKAMVPYASFTPRLWDHNSRLLTADALEDEDLFDVTNIQIDQWKERYLTGLSFVHPKERLANTRPQSLPTLLYLRANLLRGLVVTSYFLSCSRLIGKKQMAQSGAEVACDTIAVLWDLHKTTDIYHKQHPFFQHFLASSVALLFLVIMHESDSEEDSNTTIGERFDVKYLSIKISCAFNLAEAYSRSSSASERLWNRMRSMRERLSRLGIHYTSDYSKPNEIHFFKQLENDPPKRKSRLHASSAGQANRITDISLFDNPTVRPCSLNILNSNGALDYLISDPVFGLEEDVPSADCGTDAYLHDIPALESNMDNQTWRELGAIFSHGL